MKTRPNENVNITAIVAVDKHGGIGKNDDLPWRCKEDMEFFQEYTKINNTCVMGKNTFDSIARYSKKRSPLLFRNMIVLTRNPPTTFKRNQYKDVIFVTNKEELKNNLFEGLYGTKICIIGGAKMYEEFAPYYSSIVMTEFNHDYDCSVFVDVNKLRFRRPFIKREKEVITEDGVSGVITTYSATPPYTAPSF